MEKNVQLPGLDLVPLLEQSRGGELLEGYRCELASQTGQVCGKWNTTTRKELLLLLPVR